MQRILSNKLSSYKAKCVTIFLLGVHVLTGVFTGRSSKNGWH